MKKWLREFFTEVLAVFKGAFYKQFYKRAGECHMCGKCCRHVYLREEGNLITSFDQYLNLIQDDPKMKRFKPKGRDSEGGLFFSCEYISRDNKCLDYEGRPDICRAYPALSMLRYGSTPKEECGFKFVNKITGKEAKV